MDGDRYWTPDLVRDWWAQISAPSPRIESTLGECARSRGWDAFLLWEIATNWQKYLTGGEARNDARRYMFFLTEGRYPTAGETLPDL